jgi:hypothetical protein
VAQIRTYRPRGPRERPGHEVLPPDPRDPDVALAKALVRAGDRAGSKTARQSRSPGPALGQARLADLHDQARRDALARAARRARRARRQHATDSRGDLDDS